MIKNKTNTFLYHLNPYEQTRPDQSRPIDDPYILKRVVEFSDPPTDLLVPPLP